ncbi:MAG: aryl-sulfate sulfotransferase, partial [Chitinophagales bacterium]|nr:aryl-sulfate sulfotransferase [Chitinophagales bacterium]
MKTLYYRSNFIALILILLVLKVNAQFIYINPMPESRYHNPQTGIILRNGERLSLNSIQSKNIFKITGSRNGEYLFDVKLIEDEKAILLTPKKHFAEGENVTVVVNDGIKTIEGKSVNGTSFDFNIRDERSAEENKRIKDQMREMYNSEFGNSEKKPFEKSSFEWPPTPLDGLPGFTILTNTGDAYQAQIFGHDFFFFNSSESHFWIINNNGDSVYAKFDTVIFNNFTLNNNGYLTLYHHDDSSYVMLDSTYQQVAEFQMGNGYKADVHEFQIYSDKKRYMIAYDPQIVDMTVYNPNYNAAAIVVGLVIQELDSNNNVLFEWSSWDHFNILDASHIGFQNAYIDPVHCNAVERDTDGNILISCRHLSEVTKINRTTGDIIWRLGGVNNQFTFTNDIEQFTWQHDVRKLANGNITLFDNGNWHNPQRSYAKEYKLDEVNKTADLVWSNCLKIIKDIVEWQHYKTWFEPIKPVEL